MNIAILQHGGLPASSRSTSRRRAVKTLTVSILIAAVAVAAVLVGPTNAQALTCRGQYKAQYYKSVTLTNLAQTHCEDAPLDRDYGSGPIRPLSLTDNVSARWTGTFAFEAANYEFYARADDGVRVYVDGELLIDKWRDQGATDFRSTKALSAGRHQVRVEWYEKAGDAVIKVNWNKVVAPPVDTYPPDTIIDSGPGGGVANGDATFAFHGTEAGSSFECRMDSTAAATCASPKSYSGLAAGSHTFSVSAKDSAGNVDPSPATSTFTVPEPPQTNCSDGKYFAEYRNELAAIAFTTSPVLKRCEDSPLSYDLGLGSPAAGVNADDYTAVWEGNFDFAQAGDYEFTTRADDGIRVYLDGVRILDEWRDQGAADFKATTSVSAGVHGVKVEYYENGADSVAKLSWSRVASPPPASGFVVRNGEDFALGGARYRFNASAVHRLAEDDASTIAGKLDQIKAQTGVNTVRADFYQQPNATAVDWTKFDTLLREANARNMKVIVTLENHWGAPTHSNALPPEWYQGGYRQPYGTQARSYLDWIRLVGTRYRDHPALAYYVLVNEPEITGPATNDQKAVILRDMTREAATALNTADPNHLITQGVIGTGQGGVTNETHYRDLFALSDLDFAYYHDYGNEETAIPSSLSAHMSTAHALGKPIVVGEAGIAAHRCSDTVNTCYTTERRAQLFDAKIGQFYRAGGDGYVPFLWVWDDNGGAWRHSWDYGPNGDPLNAVLKAYYGG